MTHPDAPARSVQLSDGSVWRFISHDDGWSGTARSGSFIGHHRMPFCIGTLDTSIRNRKPLTAADHRAIAQVLDPQPSSDGLASLKAKIEALPVEQIEMRIPTDDGMSWNATKVFDMIDRNSVLALLKAPTADGGTT